MGSATGSTKRHYSKEEKLEVVQAVKKGMSSKQAAKDYGIHDSVVRKWVREYRAGGEEALTPKRKPGNPLVGYKSKKNLNEVEQLRYELAMAQMEIARLKKAQEQEWRDAQETK